MLFDSRTATGSAIDCIVSCELFVSAKCSFAGSAAKLVATVSVLLKKGRCGDSAYARQVSALSGVVAHNCVVLHVRDVIGHMSVFYICMLVAWNKG